MEQRLFTLQRFTALLLAPLVLVHLVTILYAVRGGLTAQQILSRTQGSTLWIGFYALFVLVVAVHAPIGVRHVLIEWGKLRRPTAGWIALAFGIALLLMGLRAVYAVGFAG